MEETHQLTYGELRYTIRDDSIEARAMCGADIKDACRDAASLANRHAKAVRFDFNGIAVELSEGDIGEDGVRRWNEAMAARDSAPSVADVLARVTAELKAVEWSGGGNVYDCQVACPKCGKTRNSFDPDVSHAPDCTLFAALALASKAGTP